LIGAAVFLTGMAFAQTARAQETAGVFSEAWPPQLSSERVFFGGYIGLSYGAIEYIEVAPLVGYRFSENFGAGLGLMYRYRKDTRSGNDVTSTDYGGNVFARYYLMSGLFTQAEYDYTSYKVPVSVTTAATERKGSTSVLAGLGFNTALTAATGAYVLVLYDFDYNGKDPFRQYSSAVQFRIGISFGF
jgi:hypothetical protein